MDKIEGWKLVPVEPTLEMLTAAWGKNISNIWDLAKDYRAMLAAAPTPPAQEIVYEFFEGDHRVQEAAKIIRKDTFIDGSSQIVLAAPESPAQEAEPVYQAYHDGAWEDVEKIKFDWCQKHGITTRILYTHLASDELRQAAEEASVEIGKFLDGEECSLDVAHENLRAELDKK